MKRSMISMKTILAVALLAAFVVPLRLLAAGHDISSVRYAPSQFSTAGPTTIAYNGNRFLTLWRMSDHIYGSLADPSGRTPAPAFPAIPFAVSSTAPQLTAAGSGYLAIWNHESVPALGTFNAAGVLERRVAIDDEPFVAPRLAFNGTNILVVSQVGAHARTPTEVAVSVYDLTGRLVNRFPLPILIYEQYAVTSIGGDFAVVTAGGAGINEWRVANDGTIRSTLQIEPPPPQPASLYEISVAAKNGRVAVAWTQGQFTTVSTAVIQPDGSIVRSLLAKGLGPAWRPAILPVDAGFAVVWNEQRTPSQSYVVAALLDGGGAPLGARPVDLAIGPSFNAAASSGKTMALTVFPVSARHAQLLLADVDPTGIVPHAPLSISDTAVRQPSPAVAGNGAGFTAAWLEPEEESQTAVAGRVNAMGEALDGPGVTVGHLVQPATPPAIAHGASGELMVWSANNQLVAARLTPFATTLDTTPIVIAPLSFPASASYSVAWNGSRFFVLWVDGAQLFEAFVGPDGIATPRRPLGIQLLPRPPLEPDVAWDGRQFIVVYGEPPPNCADYTCSWADGVRVLRVSADGIALDTNPLRIPGSHLRAHVASSGTESLIALDSITSFSAMIVRDDGGALHLGTEMQLFSWVNWLDTSSSDVAWTGSMYVVAWRYDFTQSRPGGVYYQTLPGWIGVSRITRSGVPFGSLFTPTAGPPAYETLPLSNISVAANDAGAVAMVISEMAPPTYEPRARLYLMSEMAPMPLPPRPPRNVVAYRGGENTLITWQSDGPQDGFVIEASSGGPWWSFALTLDIRSTTTPLGPYYRFRVRAIGPGGLSEPAAATVVIVDRHRAARR